MTSVFEPRIKGCHGWGEEVLKDGGSCERSRRRRSPNPHGPHRQIRGIPLSVVGKDPSIKVNSDEVVAYPRLPEMKSILLNVSGWKANDEKLVVTRAEIVQS